MRVLIQKQTVILTFMALILAAEGFARVKRSPFKKHKIIVINEGQEQETGGGGWGAPPSVAPPPQQETVVEHHHHWEVRPPPPPSSHSDSVRIEFNKGGKLEHDVDKFKEFKDGIDTAIDEIESDKQAKIDAFKEDAEEKLEALAKIPHLIASDIDFLGKKIVDDLERKKQKQGGISIQVWKGKGGHGTRGESGSEQETVHHHHYYNDNVEQRPPPSRPQTLPPPPPPTKQYYGWGGQGSSGDGVDPLFKLVNAGAHFVDFLASGGGGGHGGQYRVPVSDEGSFGSGSFESGGGWGQRGKGFGFKSKGFRRRK